MNTNDLTKFGAREIDLAIDLLKASKNVEFDLGKDLKIELNTNSGYVFLVNDDCQVFMLDSQNNLVEFFSCPDCGTEGLLEDFKEYEDNKDCCLEYVPGLKD